MEMQFMRRSRQRRAAAIAASVLAATTFAASIAPASAQDLGTGVPVNASDRDINPKIAPDTPKPVAPIGFNGPLASFAAMEAERGITFHALALNFSEVNPSLGLQRGRAANSLYIIEGVDFDLGKLAGLQGLSAHFENTFFPATENLNIAPQIGDSQVGYQPPFTPRIARLSRTTLEDKALDGRLDIEAGITHPAYYYALFNCGSINSCFQDILYFNAGYTSYLFAVPGANVSFKATPTIYAEAGVFAQQPGANYHIGYDFYQERYNGVLGMAEIGKKTDYTMDPYPYRMSLTGFLNTQTHIDYNAGTAFNGTTQTQNGTTGVVFQADKIVWRRDNGADPTNKTPTALKIYGSVGTAIDSTIPIQLDSWIGATLLAPLQSRPGDTFGLKFNWERLNPSYTQYLTASNIVAGGAGVPYRRDTYVFEANANITLPASTFFQPVVQYALNPNSYFNPASPTRAHRGVYIGGTYAIPIGVILGLAAAS